MERSQFEKLVAEALQSIPRRFRKEMRNIAIMVEDEPSPELLREMGVTPPDTLLGLYSGVPLTERSWRGEQRMPDRILIFQGPHAYVSPAWYAAWSCEMVTSSMANGIKRS